MTSRQFGKVNWLRLSICIIILLHIIFEIIHGLTHEELQITLSSFQFAYVLLVILVTPIISMILIIIKSRSFQRVGAILLLGSMLGSFIFGVFNHIITPSLDNIFTVETNLWGLLFQSSAIFLLIINAIGVGLGVWLLIEKKKLCGTRD
jgi:hypothetical protein